MLTIARSHQFGTAIGIRRAVDLATCPQLAWHRQAAGVGGHRCYDGALIGLQLTDSDDDCHGGHHALLVRRHRRTGERRATAPRPPPAPLSALVSVAGRRWTIEEAFQAGKGLTALDEHQVRRWTSWRHWTVLAMLAHALPPAPAAPARPQS